MRRVERRDLLEADHRVVVVHPLDHVALFRGPLCFRNSMQQCAQRTRIEYRCGVGRDTDKPPQAGLVAGLVGARDDAVQPVRTARAECGDVERGGVAAIANSEMKSPSVETPRSMS